MIRKQSIFIKIKEVTLTSNIVAIGRKHLALTEIGRSKGGKSSGFCMVWNLPSNMRQIIMQGPDHENLKFLYSHVMKRSYILVAKEALCLTYSTHRCSIMYTWSFFNYTNCHKGGLRC